MPDPIPTNRHEAALGHLYSCEGVPGDMSDVVDAEVVEDTPSEFLQRVGRYLQRDPHGLIRGIDDEFRMEMSREVFRRAAAAESDSPLDDESGEPHEATFSAPDLNRLREQLLEDQRHELEREKAAMASMYEFVMQFLSSLDDASRPSKIELWASDGTRLSFEF